MSELWIIMEEFPDKPPVPVSVFDDRTRASLECDFLRAENARDLLRFPTITSPRMYAVRAATLKGD